MKDHITKPKFLTGEIEKYLIQISKATNHKLSIDQRDNAHLTEHISPLLESLKRRAILIGVMGDHFSGMDHVALKHPFNMSGLVLQDDWFLRIIMIEELAEDDQLRCPKALERAIEKRSKEEEDEHIQLSLDGFDMGSEQVKKQVDLGYLSQGVIGYLVGHDKLITGFALAEYVTFEERVQNIYTIDVSNSVVNFHDTSHVEFDHSNSTTTHKIKPEYLPPSGNGKKA